MSITINEIENMKVLGARQALHEGAHNRMLQLSLLLSGHPSTQLDTPRFAEFVAKAAVLVEDIAQLRLAYVATFK
jgi:hypothetical protein